MTDEELDTADVLNAAADYIQTHGLNKGSYGDAPGPMCVLGAISASSGMSYIQARDSDPARAVYDSLHSTSRAAFWSLDEWNDSKRRTVEEVITALLEAAARLRTP